MISFGQVSDGSQTPLALIAPNPADFRERLSTLELHSETLDQIMQSFVLGKEAIYANPDMSHELNISPAVPMPIPFPAEGMVPPPGWAYSVLCLEGGGVSTLFMQKDVKGVAGHAWYEVYLASGKKLAMAHNPGGPSAEDLGKTGPKILRIAYLVTEEKALVAYERMRNFSRAPEGYNLRCHNCTDALEVAANALEIPLPSFRTPTGGTAAPHQLYKQLLTSPYYSPHVHRESRLLDIWKNFTDPSPELRQQILEIWMTDDCDEPFSAPRIPSFSGAHSSNDSLPSLLNQPRYGGIALNKKAELKIRSGDLSGAIFDPTTGQIILVGRKNIHLPEMRLDDLAVAFKSIYGLGNVPASDPAVSIEPSGEHSMKVIYSGHTRGTEFGLHLFQADAVLKGLILGSMKSSVPGYLSLPRRMEINRILDPGTSWRTWIVPDLIHLVESESGDSMVFGQIQMKCLAETTSNRGRACHQQFADHFTHNYDSFAREYPIFQEMKRLAQITGVVKWLKENEIPIDLSFFTSYSCPPFDTPLFIAQKRFPYAWIDQGRWIIGHLSGGIHLKTDIARTVAKDIEEQKNMVLSSRPNDCCLNWDLPDGSVADTCAVLKTKKGGNCHLAFLDLLFTSSKGHSLSFSRSYDSFGDRDFGMGLGWTPAQLEIPDERVLAVEPKKSAPPFVILKNREGDYLFSLKQFLPDGTLILLPDKGNTRLFLLPDESWRLQTGDETLLFDVQGRVTQTMDRGGPATHYRYEEGLLHSVTGPDGVCIDLLYQDRKLREARGPDGKSIFYQYNALGELERAGDDMIYQYDEIHRLCRFFNLGLVFEGVYDDFNRLKYEKWGPIESINKYSLQERKVKRTIKVDVDMLRSILEQEGVLGN
jgi:hypothetical protein